jgi:hypothetical protein
MLYRSGHPQHINGPATTGGTLENWPVTGGPTLQLDFQNTHATEDIELFLTKVAAEAGAGNGFIVPARVGFVLEVEVIEFWTLSTNASSFTCIAACRP